MAGETLEDDMTLTTFETEQLVFTVGGLLSPDECREQVAWAEEIGFGSAPISALGGFVHAPHYRNNTRVMVDDPQRTQWLWRRIGPYVPPVLPGGWRVLGLNERVRIYRYDEGQYFKWHLDGSYARSHSERSHLTFMVYLSDECLGGSTDFDWYGNQSLSVVPEAGTALVFDHRIRHQGAELLEGRKYVLRTDVMYERHLPPIPQAPSLPRGSSTRYA